MRELLATTEAKVLLAIDEYNELFQMSHWHYGDNKVSFVLPSACVTRGERQHGVNSFRGRFVAASDLHLCVPLYSSGARWEGCCSAWSAT